MRSIGQWLNCLAIGFLYREMQIAIQVVRNTLLGRKWKLPRDFDRDHYNIDSNEMENESEFDVDRLLFINIYAVNVEKN